MIGLLLGTVAFFAIWMVALKPHSGTSGGSQGGVGQYQPAINKAHQAVTTSNQANAKLGAPTATTPAPTKSTATEPATTSATKAATKPVTAPVTKAKAAPAAPAKPTAQSASASAAASAKTVATALRAGNVVAILFYNDAAADDRAVKSELAAIPTHGGQVVKVSVPVSQLIQFSSLTQTVEVNTAPELVLIDHARQASTLVGYADSVEIAQRINDALAAK
jgi:cytoskeletal protein RodZ